MQKVSSPPPQIRVSDIVTVLRPPAGREPGCQAKVAVDGGQYLGVRFDFESRSEVPTWILREHVAFHQHGF